MTLIQEVFPGHHVTRTRTSVFHTYLSSIQHALNLHGISHIDLPLLEARRVLIHHLASGDCANYKVDASATPRPDRSACRVFAKAFESSSVIEQVVLHTVLEADSKQISAEALS